MRVKEKTHRDCYDKGDAISPGLGKREKRNERKENDGMNGGVRDADNAVTKKFGKTFS